MLFTQCTTELDYGTVSVAIYSMKKVNCNPDVSAWTGFNALQTFPGQVMLRNFQVHNVCKYQLYRPSHAICRYTEHLLMCASRPEVSVRGLFGKASTVGKA